MTDDKIPMDTQEKLQQLQMIEQSLQASLMQRQNFQVQQIELESALNEIKDKKTAYKIIGNLMVSSDAESLRNELEQKLETTKIRLKNMEKQEEKIREKAQALQKEVLEGMKK